MISGGGIYERQTSKRAQPVSNFKGAPPITECIKSIDESTHRFNSYDGCTEHFAYLCNRVIDITVIILCFIRTTCQTYERRFLYDAVFQKKTPFCLNIHRFCGSFLFIRSLQYLYFSFASCLSVSESIFQRLLKVVCL